MYDGMRVSCFLPIKLINNLLPKRLEGWGWGCLVNGARLRKIAAWHLSTEQIAREDLGVH